MAYCIGKTNPAVSREMSPQQDEQVLPSAGRLPAARPQSPGLTGLSPRTTRPHTGPEHSDLPTPPTAAPTNGGAPSTSHLRATAPSRATTLPAFNAILHAGSREALRFPVVMAFHDHQLAAAMRDLLSDSGVLDEETLNTLLQDPTEVKVQEHLVEETATACSHNTGSI